MKRWRWTEVFYQGVALDVCVDCNAARYTGNDICPIHSEEIITPILSTGAKIAIYKQAIKQIKEKDNGEDNG
jgi:hypothetical protein